MSGPDYGKGFRLWRAEAGADWTAYTEHDFVERLADGTLPREAFLRYLIQDYIFLIHFARAWALGVVKSETLDELRIAADMVHGLIKEELKLHIQVCAAAGLSEEQVFESPEHPSNAAYTRYVMDSGLSGDLADLLAALAPCVFGYGEIGLRLAGTAAPDTPYRNWIDTYSGEPYQSLCVNVGGLVDEVLERRVGADFDTAPRWSGLCQRFTTATRFEIGFWQMGLTG